MSCFYLTLFYTRLQNCRPCSISGMCREGFCCWHLFNLAPSIYPWCFIPLGPSMCRWCLVHQGPSSYRCMVDHGASICCWCLLHQGPFASTSWFLCGLSLGEQLCSCSICIAVGLVFRDLMSLTTVSISFVRTLKMSPCSFLTSACTCSGQEFS